MSAMANNGVRHAKAVKTKARKLRQGGMAIKQIARELGISVASSWLWTREVSLTSEQIEALRGKAIDGRVKWGVKQREAKRERMEIWKAQAILEFEERKNDPLFMLGLGIYWGEGSKSTGPSMTGADVRILACWKAWLEKFAPHLGTYGGFRVHEGNDIEHARRHWARLGLDKLKSYPSWPIKEVRIRNNRWPCGVLALSCRGKGCSELQFKILHWLSMIGPMIKRN